MLVIGHACAPVGTNDPTIPAVETSEGRGAPVAGHRVVIATHDPDVIEHCDDVLELDAGRVVSPA
jgi:ABC-type ATPase involved in cell division